MSIIPESAENWKVDAEKKANHLENIAQAALSKASEIMANDRIPAFKHRKEDASKILASAAAQIEIVINQETETIQGMIANCRNELAMVAIPDASERSKIEYVRFAIAGQLADMTPSEIIQAFHAAIERGDKLAMQAFVVESSKAVNASDAPKKEKLSVRAGLKFHKKRAAKLLLSDRQRRAQDFLDMTGDKGSGLLMGMRRARSKVTNVGYGNDRITDGITAGIHEQMKSAGIRL